MEFLCLAEGGEVARYEVLASRAKDVRIEVWNPSEGNTKGRKTASEFMY